MNIVQHLVTSRPVREEHAHLLEPFVGMQGARLHSPTVVLPKSNWGTMWSRWKKYSFSPAPPSIFETLDAGHFEEVSVTLRRIPKKGITLTKDSLIANECLIRQLQDLQKAALASGELAFSVLDLKCHHHLGALVTRPIAESVGGGQLASNLVRTGHVLASSVAFKSFLDKVDILAEKDFFYRQVIELPPDAAFFAGEVKRILRTTNLPKHDLTEEDVENISEFFHTDPRGEILGHYCVVGDCSICEGSRKKCVDHTKKLLRMCLATGCPIALLYRWKYFEDASKYVERGIALYNLLPRAMALMFNKKDADM